MREVDALELVKFYEDHVVIRSAAGEYVDIEANYTLDAGQPPPVIPAGFIGRTYIPGEKHNLHTGRSNVPQRLPFVEGDTILLTVAALLTAQAARRALAPLPDEPLDSLRLQAIDVLMDERLAAADPPQAVIDYVTARDA